VFELNLRNHIHKLSCIFKKTRNTQHRVTATCIPFLCL